MLAPILGLQAAQGNALQVSASSAHAHSEHPCISVLQVVVTKHMLHLRSQDCMVSSMIHLPTGFRLCQGCGSRDDILLASLGADLPGKAIMLQASGSFFAYEPILKALQSNHSMPLAQYIAAPSLQMPTSQAGPASTSGGSLFSSFLDHSNRLFGIGASPGNLLY